VRAIAAADVNQAGLAAALIAATLLAWPRLTGQALGL
jgi:hypothetical protein